MATLDSWDSIKPVPGELKAIVKRFYINAGSTWIYLNDGRLYAFGDNTDMKLGIGGQDTFPIPGNAPRLVGPLCHTDVTSILSSNAHTIFLTAAGNVFGSGRNQEGQLGIGTTIGSSSPTGVRIPGNVKVVAISIGTQFSAALTQEGDAFLWGNNERGQIGDGTMENFSTSPKMLQGHKLKAISCGGSSVVAITTANQVIAWGDNRGSRLGVGVTGSQARPVVVQFPGGNTIHTAISLESGCIYLDTYGLVYTTGYIANSGRDRNLPSPSLVDIFDKVEEISAAQTCPVIACKTLSGKVFYWGKVGSTMVSKPSESIGTSNLWQVHQKLSPSECMIHMMDVKDLVSTDTEEEFSHSIAKFFDDKTFSDLHILVGGEVFHCHKSILMMRSEYFRNLFDSNWKPSTCQKSGKETYSMDPHPVASVRSYLYFLYSGKLNNDKEQNLPMSASDLIDLLAVADHFAEDRLKKHAEDKLSRLLAMDNIIPAYQVSLKLGANKTSQDPITMKGSAFGSKLRDSVYRFALANARNFKEIISQEDHEHRSLALTLLSEAVIQFRQL